MSRFRIGNLLGKAEAMSNNWKLTKLRNLCKTNQQTYSPSENWSYINYLDTGNITENRINEIQKIIPEINNLPSRARRKVIIDDIIYSTVRPNQRHYGIIKDIIPNMLVSTGFTVITVDKTKADSCFLYYFLTQDDIINNLHNIGEQSVSAYPSIKSSDIEELEIMLPPLTKQIEIGQILRVLDDKMELNEKINHHLSDSMSETLSSPDIKRGKRVSRRVARRRFSLRLKRICSNKEVVA